MSEIWDADVNGAVPTDDDAEWSEGSDSEPTPAPGRPKRKRGQAVPARRGRVASDDADGDQQPQDDDDEQEDDDLLAAYFTAAAKRAKQGRQQQQKQPRSRQGRQGSSSPVVLLDSDEPTDSGAAAAVVGEPATGNGQLRASIAAAAAAAAAAAGAQPSTAVLSEQARAAAEREAELRRQLQEAAAAALEDEDEEEEDVVEEVQPAVQRWRPGAAAAGAADVEDLTFDLDDILPSDEPGGEQQQRQPGGAAAAGAAGGRGDADEGGRLPLTFRTGGCEDVTVRIKPGEPLSAAFNKFRAYVAEQGWGSVQKFVSPDGDRLSGEETAAELALEEGDIIEYYLQK